MKRIGSILLMAWLGLTAYAQVSQMEQQFMLLEERFDVRDKTLPKDLKQYLVLYPYTTYADEVHFMQGVMQVEKGMYKQSLKELELVDFKSLSRPHQPQYQFYRGYANLMMQRYDRASVYFNILRKNSNPYQQKGAYYYAYCQYKLGNYENAQPALEALENNATYRKTIPYFLVQLYYSQRRDDEVIERSQQLLKDQPDNPNNPELHRILGEIYFQREDYRAAVSHLKTYETGIAKQEDTKPVRNDLYLLGVSFYHLKDYTQAIQYLKKVEVAKDSLSESVYLCLGNAYKEIGDIEQAKLNYHAASQAGISTSVREEAMYNYALMTYHSSSALGESVNAFMDFLKLYPNSKYENQILTLMSDALRRSKNFEAALSALDSISNPDAKLLETKQYLRYQLGADAYVQGKMEKAHQWFTAVLDNAGSGREDYVVEASYWRAETDYRLGRYEDCQKDLNRYYQQDAAGKSPNRAAAKYLNGYNCFAQKQYSEAKRYFEDYLKDIFSTDPTYADALNRLGDCEFNARHFNEAIAYYSRAVDCRTEASDYACFQKGYAQGLQRKYDSKIATMTDLVTRYPKSDYADDALYEIARANLQQDKERAALQAYEQLLTKYPRSNHARKACLERAMLFRNLNETQQAIAAYKQTIERYPATEEAYTALAGLEALCVETNRVNEYVAYSKNLGKYHMTTSFKEDSLKYTAHYMAAVNYYTAKQYDKALHEFDALTKITGNPYQLEAYTRAAELAYDKKDYTAALGYFTALVPLCEKREQLNIARLGILRCNENLHRTQATIDIATQILTDEPVTEAMRSEALYNRAHAYIEKGEWGLAVVDLTPLSKEVRTAQGAEAKYLLSMAYYQLGALQNAEDEIMSFAQMNTQQQYWLAKALILLADINLDKGDTFQARQYLLTLVNNYRRSDDILSTVQTKLQVLDAIEADKQPVETEEEEEVL